MYNYYALGLLRTKISIVAVLKAETNSKYLEEKIEENLNLQKKPTQIPYGVHCGLGLIGSSLASWASGV